MAAQLQAPRPGGGPLSLRMTLTRRVALEGNEAEAWRAARRATALQLPSIPSSPHKLTSVELTPRCAPCQFYSKEGSYAWQETCKEQVCHCTFIVYLFMLPNFVLASRRAKSTAVCTCLPASFILFFLRSKKGQ